MICKSFIPHFFIESIDKEFVVYPNLQEPGKVFFNLLSKVDERRKQQCDSNVIHKAEKFTIKLKSQIMDLFVGNKNIQFSN